MKQCLDEGTLQSYFDGELSTELMESATSHLASCAMCSQAARELEQESYLLSNALAAEFEASVPTERLRQRIDSAVAGLSFVPPQRARTSVFGGLLSSFSNLVNFTPQRTLGYASLVVVLAFAAIFGLLKFRDGRQAPVAENPAKTNPTVAISNAPVAPRVDPVMPESVDTGSVATISRTNEKSKERLLNRVRPVAKGTTPAAVKLIPGERTYLQTIAKLDSSIKSDNKIMRPALQVEYEKNLAVVDRAIAATRNAAKNNPNDPDAAEFMFAAYQSKVNLLNTIADARDYNRAH